SGFTPAEALDEEGPKRSAPRTGRVTFGARSEGFPWTAEAGFTPAEALDEEGPKRSAPHTVRRGAPHGDHGQEGDFLAPRDRQQARRPGRHPGTAVVIEGRLAGGDGLSLSRKSQPRRGRGLSRLRQEGRGRRPRGGTGSRGDPGPARERGQPGGPGSELRPGSGRRRDQHGLPAGPRPGAALLQRLRLRDRRRRGPGDPGS